ncbi:MAG TPA: hypothetical protein VHE59_03730 [Mucilaginibacter sp.]|nr:hypothetical protein [Mucilaginibacter sp.]
MENLQIGNWLITNDGIEWTGSPYAGYYINKDRLLQESTEKPGTFDWLLHMAHKPWLKERDVYELNIAFLIALGLLPHYKRSKLSMGKTLEEQEQIIARKKHKKGVPVFGNAVSRVSVVEV